MQKAVNIKMLKLEETLQKQPIQGYMKTSVLQME